MKPQPPPSLLLGLEPVQSCLGVARVMSNYGYKKKSVPVMFQPPCTYVRRLTKISNQQARTFDSAQDFTDHVFQILIYFFFRKVEEIR